MTQGPRVCVGKACFYSESGENGGAAGARGHGWERPRVLWPKGGHFVLCHDHTWKTTKRF